MHGPRPISSALERARSLSQLVSEDALAAERLGRLTDPVADAMLKANLFSILTPEAAGGLGGTRLDFFDACEELANADGSAGWCLSVCNAVNSTIRYTGGSARMGAPKCSDMGRSRAGRLWFPMRFRSL